MLVVSFAAVCVLHAAGASMDLADVRGRAIEATHAACDAILTATGEGYFQRRISKLVEGRVETVQDVKGAFTFAYSDARDFVKFQDSPNPEFDAQVYVLDGDSVLWSDFSRGMHPYGAQGHIVAAEGDLGNPQEFGVAPHAIARVGTYFDPAEKRFEDAVASLKDVDGRYVIGYDQKGFVTEFVIDPRKDFHVVRLQTTMRDGRRYFVIEKEWAKTPTGLWYVRRYHEEYFPLKATLQGTTWRFDFTKFEPNVDLPTDLFTVDALGLPVGARILDRRFQPAETLRVKAPKADVAMIEKIVGELPKSAVAYAPKSSPSSRVRWGVLITSIGMLLIVAGLVLHRVFRPSRKMD